MICAACGNDAATRRCTRCKVVAYCNTSCQKSDWKEHKKTCQRKDDGSAILSEDVSIKLSYEDDDRGEFYAFTSISVDILVRNENAGSIEGVLVNRHRIPPGSFLTAMDGHSHEMQMIATAVYEPRAGRTKLISLRDGGDVHTKDMLYIESININEQYRLNNSSDVGAYAIRKLLRHDMIKGNITQGSARTGGGVWCGVSSCVYILDPPEAMPKSVRDKYESDEMKRCPWHRREEEEDESAYTKLERELEEEEATKQRQKLRDEYARLDANQFLRNGFYQDEAVAKDVDSYIIIAGLNHLKEPFKTHSNVADIKFFTREYQSQSPSGKDAEILELTKRTCINDMEENAGKERATSYSAKVSSLLNEGGSLVAAHALHAACALGDFYVAQSILVMNPNTLESRDVHNATPLILAAAHMAGQGNMFNGFPASHPIIDLLLDFGADKDATNLEGLTSYGTFKSYHRDYTRSLQAMSGNVVTAGRSVPGQDVLERKLMPNRGPTAADLSYGEGADRGYIEFDDDSEYDDYDY